MNVDSLFLCDSLSKLQYHALLLVMMWGDKMPTWWEEVRWMTQALWRHTRLMLTFWWYIRRRIISFRWSWIIEPWWCWYLDVRNRWYGRLEILGRLEQDCMRFHPVTQNSSQFLNLWIVYSWNFPFNIFRSWLTVGNRNHRKWNWGQEGNTVQTTTEHMKMLNILSNQGNTNKNKDAELLLGQSKYSECYYNDWYNS